MTVNQTCPHLRRISLLCLMLPALAVGTLASAQNEPMDLRDWWSPEPGGSRDRGKLSELVNRNKVYVTTSFVDSRTAAESESHRSGDVRRMVLSAFQEQKELQVVPTPSQADFAVVVRATVNTETDVRAPNFSTSLDATTSVGVEVMVVVPGSKRSDGTIRPRIVWESSTTNAQVEPGSAARFTVDGFLWELSTLKEKVKAKTK
jgi:hypothetical protein